MATISRSLYELLFNGWLITLPTIFSMASLWIVLALVLVLGFAGFKISRTYTQSDKPFSKSRFLFVIGAFALVCAAFMFALFAVRRDSDWRIYILGSISASILIGNTLHVLSYKFFPKAIPNRIFLLVSIIFFAFAFQHSVQRLQHYVDIAQNKAKFLEFAESVESVSPEASIIFLTELSGQELEAQIDVIYALDRITVSTLKVQNHAIDVDTIVFCSFTDNNCLFNAEGITIPANEVITVDRTIPYEEMIFFWVEPDLSVQFLGTLPANLSQLAYAHEVYQPLDYITFVEN